MTNRLLIDLKEDHNGNITGTLKFPADGSFTLEAILTALEEFSKTFDRKPSEVLADMYSYQKHIESNRHESSKLQ